MSALSLLTGLGLPVAMLVGAIAAWRMMKSDDRRDAEEPKWRDDSLDDWRKQRDAEIEAERTARMAEARAGQATMIEESEAAQEAQRERRHHQRLGG